MCGSFGAKLNILHRFVEFACNAMQYTVHNISSYVIIFSLDFLDKPSCIQLNEKRKRFVQFFMELKWVCNHLLDFKGQTDPLCCISDWPQNWDDLWNLSYLQGFVGYILLILGPNISTTPLRQCLPFSWTTLRGKHCRHPIAIMRVVNMLKLGHRPKKSSQCK